MLYSNRFAEAIKLSHISTAQGVQRMDQKYFKQDRIPIIRLEPRIENGRDKERIVVGTLLGFKTGVDDAIIPLQKDGAHWHETEHTGRAYPSNEVVLKIFAMPGTTVSTGLLTVSYDIMCPISHNELQLCLLTHSGKSDEALFKLSQKMTQAHIEEQLESLQHLEIPGTDPVNVYQAGFLVGTPMIGKWNSALFVPPKPQFLAEMYNWTVEGTRRLLHGQVGRALHQNTDFTRSHRLI